MRPVTHRVASPRSQYLWLAGWLKAPLETSRERERGSVIKRRRRRRNSELGPPHKRWFGGARSQDTGSPCDSKRQQQQQTTAWDRPSTQEHTNQSSFIHEADYPTIHLTTAPLIANAQTPCQPIWTKKSEQLLPSESENQTIRTLQRRILSRSAASQYVVKLKSAPGGADATMWSTI